jgi:hypothetical protein
MRTAIILGLFEIAYAINKVDISKDISGGSIAIVILSLMVMDVIDFIKSLKN